MTPDEMLKLRAAFEPDQIGKLPKPTRADAQKGNCNVCQGYHGLPAVHLDFVGHADITDRLLNVDPDWTWEPMGRTPEGLPALDGYGNLWINLTICGVTRPGVGDGKSMKECVGDALRNAAMRFGVALDLWAKGDRNFGLAGHDAPAREQTGPTLKEQVLTAARTAFTSQETFYADFKEQTGRDFPTAPQTALSEYLAHLAPFNSPAGLAEQDPPTHAPAAPARQGTDPVTTIRDKALAATKKVEVTRLLMRAAEDGIGGAMTTDGDGNGVYLEAFLNARLKQVA